MSVFCPQCGANNPDSARFCDQCGAALIPVPAAQQNAASMVVPTSGATPVAGPSICPQCGTPVIPGEAFCDTCGAPLIATTQVPVSSGASSLPYATAVPQQPIYPAPQQVTSPAPSSTPSQVVPPQAVPPPFTPAAPTRTSLAPGRLIIQTSGFTLPLPSGTQATVGRADAVSQFTPEIDLTDQGALENGVGRRHIRLFVENGQVYAEDLDSTNGSFLNNQKLQPRQPQVVASGDELRLGRLVLRVEL